MPGNDKKSRRVDNEVEVEGLPVIRPRVAGIDLGSQEHWACAPQVDGQGRDVEKFGATTPELERVAGWLQERGVESVAMESTGVYWVAPHAGAGLIFISLLLRKRVNREADRAQEGSPGTHRDSDRGGPGRMPARMPAWQAGSPLP